MERSLNKAERLMQIEALLLSHPDGLNQAEIARKLVVNRSTIHRYLPDLTTRFAVYERDDGRLAIDRDHYLLNVRLTLHESMALHLAARLLATGTDKQNPHAAAALRKLGLSMEKLAPRISQHLLLSAGVMESQAQRHDPVYLEVLETLTRAWSVGRQVRLAHQMPDGRVFEYTFEPYFIEPYVIGRTGHVIGRREAPNLPPALRTFKLERIRRITLLDTSYQIPADFDPERHLADAWGIWASESEPVEVVLRFHPRVSQRLRETQWHHSETLEEEPSGHLLWRAQVAEPREMLPWVRGWGADVEVLTPDWLRRELVAEARRLAAVYEIKSIPTWQLLWAKTDRATGETHPLICHLLDVAAVSLVLWQQVLTASFRGRIAAALGLDEDNAGRMLAFWAGLHDLGKACPAFQRLYSPAQATLKQAGVPFPTVFGNQRFYHATASAKLLPELLQQECSLDRRPARAIARVLGGHHGGWPHPLELQKLTSSEIGAANWDELRLALFRELRNCIDPPALEQWPADRIEQNSLLAVLSGFVSVADWLGSMERYFAFESAPIDPAGYWQQATAQAGRVLSEQGWLDWHPPAAPLPFEELFPFAPNPVQQAAIKLAPALDRPALVIIEVPTGAGKTEAALYLADYWAARRQQCGLYVAMPTMATSNQMHTRISAMLDQRYPQGTARPLLVHSQARWMRDVDEMATRTEDPIDDQSWFLPRKRSLLAPFGVGTVDQALLAVLQARHFFVRLFGLGYKTVIFDEAHAYDTYMSTLFQRLLGWLAAIGTSVVVLSATLPAVTRRELLAAYGGEAGANLPETPYPAISWATDQAAGVVPLPAGDQREIALEWIDPEPAVLVETLRRELCDGGCAAVICNTVQRAQDVYLALLSANLVPPGDLILFHARFPLAWREQIEQEVLQRFGKGTANRRPAIVVATQVIEQSLDLDFDLMLSELAPIDLLLQRAGRLHRHTREIRPAPLTAPRLLLMEPARKENGAPDFGGSSYVYEPYVLWRSLLVLQGRAVMQLPHDTVALIETVYGKRDLPFVPEPALAAALDEALAEMVQRQMEETGKAKGRLIPPAGDSNLLNAAQVWLAEDRPELHQALQALTRLIRPTVSLVCLHRTPAGLVTDPGRPDAPIVDLDRKPDSDLTAELARHTINVSHQGIVHPLLNKPAPTGWLKHSLLRNHRAAIFEGGVCRPEELPYELVLDRQLGLRISKLETQ